MLRCLPLLAATVLLTACGGSGNSPSTRDGVSAYIVRVNAIEGALQGPLASARQAVGTFARHRSDAATRARLAAAQATLVRLQKRVAATPAPAHARKLKRLLGEWVSQQVALTRELRRLTEFNPAFAAALRPLAPANLLAQTRLHNAKKPTVAAAAVTSYRQALETALARLRVLHPPAVEAPGYRAQVGRIVALDSALGSLAAAIEANDARAIVRAERAVSSASVSSDSRANQLAERAAAVAFDRAVARVSTLAVAVQAERNRLSRTLR